jgi:hypothetical protein
MVRYVAGRMNVEACPALIDPNRSVAGSCSGCARFGRDYLDTDVGPRAQRCLRKRGGVTFAFWSLEAAKL